MLGRLFGLSSPRTFAPTLHVKPNVVSRPGIGNFSRFRGFTTSSRSNQRNQWNQQNRYQRFNDPFQSAQQGPQYQPSFWSRFTPLQRILVVGIGGGAPIFYLTHLETVPE